MLGETMTKKDKDFPTEVALCAAYLETVDKRVWTPYAETAGWDILLVRKIDGFQIGIQAKLKMGLNVVNQAIAGVTGWNAGVIGPDCRAVLVPNSAGFSEICKHIGLEIISAYPRMTSTAKWRFDPDLPDQPGAYCNGGKWSEWAPQRRHELPDYVPDVAAGARAPIQLTEWKIKALKLAIILERNGKVFRSDFKALNLDARRWIDGHWLTVSRDGLVPGAGFPDFKKMHPKVYDKIAADFDKWAPKQDGLRI